MSDKVRDLIEKLNIELAIISETLRRYEKNRIGKKYIMEKIQYKIKKMFERLDALEKLLKP